MLGGSRLICGGVPFIDGEWSWLLRTFFAFICSARKIFSPVNTLGTIIFFPHALVSFRREEGKIARTFRDVRVLGTAAAREGDPPPALHVSFLDFGSSILESEITVALLTFLTLSG